MASVRRCLVESLRTYKASEEFSDTWEDTTLRYGNATAEATTAMGRQAWNVIGTLETRTYLSRARGSSKSSQRRGPKRSRVFVALSAPCGVCVESGAQDAVIATRPQCAQSDK